MRNDKLEMLVKVERGDFKREQESNSSLKEVCKKAKLRKLRYEIRNLLVERKTQDNHGNERIQLVVPQKYREDILGARYFWANVIRGTEDFVKSCDPCQRERPS